MAYHDYGYRLFTYLIKQLEILISENDTVWRLDGDDFGNAIPNLTI